MASGTIYSDPIREQVIISLHGRCVRCRRSYDVVHEIVPRSNGKDAYRITNRVTLCYECHEWAHRNAQSLVRSELHRLRLEALKRYDEIREGK